MQKSPKEIKLSRKRKQIGGKLATLLRHVAAATGVRSRPLDSCMGALKKGN